MAAHQGQDAATKQRFDAQRNSPIPASTVTRSKPF
jgi:hypothetical protein